MSTANAANNDRVHVINQGFGRAAAIGKRLDRGESFWRNQERWLKAAGYVLRPRYQTEWVPSWQSSRDLSKSEDSVQPFGVSLIDAIRELDGTRVMMKRVHSDYSPREIDIATLFSSEPLASDPRNHCIPIYEVLQLPEDNDYRILVMPFLLKFDDPPFTCLGEVVEFLKQLLEGLQFMHQQNVAHGDVKINNIMSDTLPLFEVPPHPVFPTIMTFSGGYERKLTSSQLQRSINHYLVDFGLSHIHHPGSLRLQDPGYGGNRTVPEFQNNAAELCDPFAVDVYCMGDFMRTRFRKGGRKSPSFWGLEFMDDLIADMVKEDPTKRPTIDGAVERFSQIVNHLSKWKLMSRAATVDEPKSERIIKNVKYWIGL
ncbi:kinase-like domain-containing protein [Cyathus striatus]|nr:kinase-like domain-containing protein [Cyathus striatus]